jgi:solute carrier family 25 protein 38
MYSITRQVIASQGITGMWRGSAATAWRTAPGAGLYFVSVHHMRSIFIRLNELVDSNASLSPWQNAIVGGTSRCVSALVLHPFSVVKTRAEAGTYDPRFASFTQMSPYRALRTMHATEGWRSWWRGLVPTLARDVPYSTIYVTSFEACKASFSNHIKLTSDQPITSTQKMAITIGSALCGATLATLSTQIQDVMKTHAQLLVSTPTTESAPSAGWTIASLRSSIAPLFQGASARLVRKVSMTALTWTIYEFLAMS